LSFMLLGLYRSAVEIRFPAESGRISYPLRCAQSPCHCYRPCHTEPCVIKGDRRFTLLTLDKGGNCEIEICLNAQVRADRDPIRVADDFDHIGLVSPRK
jgi:hypothetical protein